MKYQVYLNKQTSMSINELAEKANQKPNTYIKKFIEGFMKIYNAAAPAVAKELEKDGYKQQ